MTGVAHQILKTTATSSATDRLDVAPTTARLTSSASSDGFPDDDDDQLVPLQSNLKRRPQATKYPTPIAPKKTSHSRSRVAQKASETMTTGPQQRDGSQDVNNQPV